MPRIGAKKSPPAFASCPKGRKIAESLTLRFDVACSSSRGWSNKKNAFNSYTDNPRDRYMTIKISQNFDSGAIEVVSATSAGAIDLKLRKDSHADIHQ